MTDCIRDNTAVEFVEGILSPPRAARVEKHLACCDACRMRVVALGTSPSRLAAAPTPPATPSEHPMFLPGSLMGRFTVLRELGRGGMGIVLAAHDPDLDRRVALKIMKSTSSELAANDERGSLMREARAMARLDHPNIVTVYEVGYFQHETYIAMELVRGVTLGDWLRRWEPRSWQAVVGVFRQAALALAHAHVHGVAHGDFKPDNVLVDERDQVRVTDFGLSRRIDPLSEAYARLAGEPRLLAGTPRYMAPEQFLGQPSDARTDQFAFCVALYEALYGQHPFAHDTPLSLVRLPPDQAVRQVPSRPSIPAWVSEAVRKGLAQEPAARHASMDELVRALAPPLPRASIRPMIAVAALVLLSLGGYAAGARQGNANTQIAAPGGNPGGDPGPRRATRREFGPDEGGTPVDLQTGAANALRYVRQVFAPAHAFARGVQSMVVEELRLLERVLIADRARDQHEGEELRPVVVAQSASGGNPRSGARAEKTYAVEGISVVALRDSVESRWRDLEVCFREWRERRPYERGMLNVELRIDASGRAVVIKPHGMGDTVVRQCVAGALEAGRYPAHVRATIAEVTFRSADDVLRLIRLRSRGVIAAAVER